MNRHELNEAAKPLGERISAVDPLVSTSISDWLTIFISHMEENNECWTPVAVVEIEQTEDRDPNYRSYPHVRIKGDENRRLYLRMENEDPFGHYYVWQTAGCCEDDYSGWMLFPLPDGKYLQVSYSC